MSRSIICQFYDNEMEAMLEPVVFMNESNAKRTFIDIIIQGRDGSNIARFPDQFELYKTAVVKEDGEILLVKKELLLTGEDALKMIYKRGMKLPKIEEQKEYGKSS